LASRQQRFEGPDLESLLDRIRTDLGEQARIVAANRVRKGGVGGFFSREHYEVVVERDAEAEADADAMAATAVIVDLDERADDAVDLAARPSAASVLELAEAVNGTERVRQGRRKRKDSTTESPRAIESESVLDLTGASADSNGTEPAVSTETERFVEILDRIARDVDPRRSSTSPDEPLPSPSSADNIAAGLHRAVDENGDVWIDDRPISTPTRDVEIAHDQADKARRSARAPRRTRSEPTSPDEIEIRDEADQIAGISVFATNATPFLPPRVRRTRQVDVIERPENVLSRLGVPARYIPRGVSGSQLRGALIESLAGLPVATPLPEANGVVIAVVGIGAQPVMLARTLATERGLDPDNLVLATARELGEGIPSWLQICDPATAEERRRSWRRRDHETLVAVSIPSVTQGHEWAREMLDHLEPTQTWGIVNAAWKVEDAQAWADHLGGFDVLAVDHLADTVSPAAPIALDIPIGRLDGRPASALAWAEILCDRMAQR
jgi:hypothetical protein